MPFRTASGFPENEALIANALTAQAFDIQAITGRPYANPVASQKWQTAEITCSDGQAFALTVADLTPEISITFRCPAVHTLTMVLHFPTSTAAGYVYPAHTETYQRTVWVGIALDAYATAMTVEPPATPVLLSEPFLLLRVGQAQGVSAILPLTRAGRPWVFETSLDDTRSRLTGSSAVRFARSLQRHFVHRALAVPPPELAQAPEGVYGVFEQSLLYLGVAAGLAPLVENLREAFGNDAARGLPPLRTPQLIAALGAILNFATREVIRTGLFASDQLASPPNRLPTILPARSTANWSKAMAVQAQRNAVVSGQTAAAYQQTLAPRDLDRDDAALRWLYVYATGACEMVRRLGESLGHDVSALPRYPASMFVWNQAEATQTVWVVDTNRTGDGTVPPRQYLLAAQTTLGLLQPAPTPDLPNLVRYAAGLRRVVASDAEARQVLGQNKQLGDLLIRDGQDLLRLRAHTGEIARVRPEPAIAQDNPGGHPGEAQRAKGWRGDRADRSLCDGDHPLDCLLLGLADRRRGQSDGDLWLAWAGGGSLQRRQRHHGDPAGLGNDHHGNGLVGRGPGPEPQIRVVARRRRRTDPRAEHAHGALCSRRGDRAGRSIAGRADGQHGESV